MNFTKEEWKKIREFKKHNKGYQPVRASQSVAPKVKPNVKP